MIGSEVPIDEMSSGCVKSREALDHVIDFRWSGLVVQTEDGRKWRFVKNLKSKTLKKGMIVAFCYNHYNQGFEIGEVVGWTGDDKSYGEGGLKYESTSEMLEANGVKTVKELEEKEDRNDYGFRHYLGIRTFLEDDEGPDGTQRFNYYIFEGRVCCGSGAEPMTFMLVEEVE